MLERRRISEQTQCMAKRSMRKAADEVAGMMAASLSRFSETEQNKRLKAIHEIALSARASKRGKSSKRSNTRRPALHPGFVQDPDKSVHVS